MSYLPNSFGLPLLLVVLAVGIWGCGGSEAVPTADTDETSLDVDLGEAEALEVTESSSEDDNRPKRSFKPVTLGGDRGAESPGSATGPADREKNADSVVAAMQPLQVVLGTWRGITQKAYGGFKAVDELNWVWDFKTDDGQPALVATSDASPYLSQGRLTYLTDQQVYQFATEDKDGEKRVYQGTFIEPPQDVPGDDKKLQRKYKLELTQVEPESTKEVWRVVFNQQENNRYLMELYRQRSGNNFFRFDTVSTQREGTSFALNDTDYKEKTCIISQGLGTIQVSHEGKSYWVCCSGCKAAFEEDPQKWLAKLAAREKAAE